MLALLLAALPIVSTPTGAREASAAWCAECHAREHEQWASSRHAAAATDRLYVTNHAQEPMAWCDGCHAPLGQRDEGVGCASCHVADGAVLSSHAPTAKGLEAHAVREAPALGTPAACERCHQVNFPVGRAEPVTPSRWPMQNTVAEWQASGTSKPCQRCHLPRGEHAMTGGHDLEKVRKALEVSVAWAGDSEVRVTLASRHVPHALPTGDPFRALRVDLLDADGAVVGSRRFGRTIAPAGDSWRIADDWTIPAPAPGRAPERTFEFQAPPTAREYRLTLVYVGDATAVLLDASETEAEVLRGPISGGARARP
jgi:hypothetical protein